MKTSDKSIKPVTESIEKTSKIFNRGNVSTATYTSIPRFSIEIKGELSEKTKEAILDAIDKVLTKHKL